MELHEALRSHPDFEKLDVRDLEILERGFAVEEWPAQGQEGHEFLEEGSRPDAAWLILDGEVTVTRLREPFVDELRRLGPGDLFGLVSLVDEGKRSATCRSVGAVRVARIERSAFDWLIRDHAPVGLALQRAVARQLAMDYRECAKRIRSLLAKR